jgi:tetratricopeptide (TPR) repeat protein
MNLDSTLSELEAQQLIRKLYSDADGSDADSEFIFKHVLVQEAAYGSLLKTARAELHRRVAEILESLKLGLTEEGNSMLAWHYDRAGMDDKALLFALHAADAARKRHAHMEALAGYDHALQAAQRLRPLNQQQMKAVRAAYVNRGAVLESKNRYVDAVRNYADMIAFAEQTGDRSVHVEGLNHINTVRILTEGAATDTLPELEQALQLARGVKDPLLIGRALWNLGLFFRFDHPERAQADLQQALDIAQNTAPMTPEMRELGANVLTDLTISMIGTGDFRHGLELAERAAREFRDMGNRLMLTNALGDLGYFNYFMGRPDRARSCVEEGLRISREIGSPWGMFYMSWTLNDLALDVGDYERVLSQAESSIALAQLTSFAVFVGYAHLQITRACLETRQFDLALVHAEQSLNAFESTHSRSFSACGYGVLARVLIGRGEIERARALLDPYWRAGEAPAINFSGLIFIAPVFAQLALADGRLDFGIQVCDWLLNHAEREGALRLAGEMRYWRAELHHRRGDAISARVDLVQAQEWLSHCRATALVRKVEASLARLDPGKPPVA